MPILGQIQISTGACVSAKGRYKQMGDCAPDEPLYLKVTADSEEKLRSAVDRIKQMIGPNVLKVAARPRPACPIPPPYPQRPPQAHMSSAVCTVGIEPTAGFDSVAEIQGAEVLSCTHPCSTKSCSTDL